VILSPDPPPPAVLEVLPDGDRWRLRSSDGLFSGTFLDRRSALRHAVAEAETHPGHVVVVREN
jgi:hypothetical protein